MWLIRIKDTVLLAAAFWFFLTVDAKADGQCEIPVQPSEITYSLHDETGVIIGTAFPIDPRGIFLTAKHLTYQRNLSSLTLRNEALDHEFELAGILTSGRYNRVDSNNLNSFDDWTVIWVNPGEQELMTFSYQYDRRANVNVRDLVAHSHLGQNAATAASQLGLSKNSPCDESDVFILSLSGYQKTSSGAPLTDNRCAFGVTSRFDAAYTTLQEQLSGSIEGMKELNRISTQILDRTRQGQLRENFISELTSTIESDELRRCVENSEVQCTAQHMDELRRSLAQLEFVVVTPLSCVADSFVEIFVSEEYEAFTAQIRDAHASHQLNSLLDTQIESPRDMARFVHRISVIPSNMELWNWVSYLQLIQKAEEVAAKGLDRRPLDGAIRLIGQEHQLLDLKDWFRNRIGQIKEQELAELRALEARRQDELQGNLRQIDFLQRRLGTLQTQLNAVPPFPGINGNSQKDRIQREIQDAQREISEARLQIANTQTELERATEERRVLDSSLENLNLASSPEALSFEQQERELLAGFNAEQRSAYYRDALSTTLATIHSDDAEIMAQLPENWEPVEEVQALVSGGNPSFDNRFIWPGMQGPENFEAHQDFFEDFNVERAPRIPFELAPMDEDAFLNEMIRGGPRKLNR